jgi:phage terminase large subunit-like protein
MSDVILAQEQATLLTLMGEREKRNARIAQSAPGIDPRTGRYIHPDRGLLAFIKYFWKILEPETPFVDGWPLRCIIQHLEAVTLGKITRCMINVPPGSCKSLTTNVFWPAWEWGPMDMAHLRYVSFAYSSGLTERDNIKFRQLVSHDKYTALWGDRFSLVQEGAIKVSNSKTGSKFASSVKGIGLGERGDRIVCDDPHNVQLSESDVVREDTLKWFRETITDRLNDLEKSAIVIIMQRVHQLDICGMILEENWPYTHCMIPMRFEADRPVKNALGWQDIRTVDGELAWPERFSPNAVERIEIEKGKWAFAGQYQQRPSPRGGGVIEFDWWQAYTPDTALARFGMVWPMYPPMSFSILSVDTAQTEKKQNDPSAGVLIGICQDVNGRNQVMIMWAWTAYLEFFELCNKVEETCRDYRVHQVVIEGKASGLPLAQELRRRGQVFADRLAHNPKTRDRADFGVRTIEPEGDKFARMCACQNLFEAGVIWAPADEHLHFKTWADKCMVECAEIPHGRSDDLADAISMGLTYLRNLGLARMPDDALYEVDDDYKKQRMVPLYPSFGMRLGAQT